MRPPRGHDAYLSQVCLKGRRAGVEEYLQLPVSLDRALRTATWSTLRRRWHDTSQPPFASGTTAGGGPPPGRGRWRTGRRLSRRPFNYATAIGRASTARVWTGDSAGERPRRNVGAPTGFVLTRLRRARTARQVHAT